MSPPEITVPIFTTEDLAEVKAAARRQLVYLDSNVWIDLAQESQWSVIAQGCREAVRSGKLLFPVSNPTVTELLDQPSQAQREQVAALMDELSTGKSYLPSEEIYDLEVAVARNILLGQDAIQLDRGDTLSWISDYLGKQSLNFDSEFASHHTRIEAERIAQQIAGLPQYRSVQWLVKNLPVDEMRKVHDSMKARYVAGMSAEAAKCSTKVQLVHKHNRRNQLLLELRHSWALNKIIIPRIISALHGHAGPSAVIAERLIADQRAQNRLMQEMSRVPSLDLSCRIFTEWILNRTVPFENQDFQDFEHAVVGAVYSDFFVTSDRYLMDLLTGLFAGSNVTGCRLVPGVGGLSDILSTVD